MSNQMYCPPYDSYQLPPRPSWTVVAHTSGDNEAASVVVRLNMAGIAAILRSEAHAAYSSIGLNAATVCVPQTDYQLAMMILYPDDLSWLYEDPLINTYDDAAL
jgi:hypothetical protein